MIKTGGWIMEGLEIGIKEGQVEATIAGEAAGAAVTRSVAQGAAGAEASVVAAGNSIGTGVTTGVAGGIDKGTKGGKIGGSLGRMGKVFSGASKVMSGAMRGLGGAMNFMMGPWGMLIMILLPILLPLLQKLNDKFHIMDKVMAGLQWTLDKLVEGFKWLWDKIKAMFDWVKANWPLLVGILTGPFGLAVVMIIKHWDTVLGFIKGIPAKITGFLSHMWDVLSSGLTRIWTRVQTIWAGIVTWVKGRPAQFMRNMKAIWGILSDGLHTAWTKVQEIWGRIVTWVKGRPAQFVTNLSGLWNSLRDGLSTALTAVKSFWTDKVMPWITGLPGKVGTGLKDLFLGVANGFVSAVNWVGGKMNKYLWDPINSVLDKFGVTKISFQYDTLPKLKGFATGGPVRGPGGPKSDSIPARLSNGEHVLTAKEVRAMGGHGAVESMRRNALNGGTGGLWGFVKDKYADVEGAIAKGAQVAIKWVIGNFTSHLGTGVISDIVNGILTSAAGKISGWGKKKDEEAAAAAAAAGDGAPYTGPPGGWTYPLARRYGITQYPNSGHNPTWSVDIGAPGGTGVRAASVGTVAIVRSLGNRSYGNYVVISHAGGQQTLYAHLKSFAVKQGQKVKTGQTIGYSDSTGHSTGNHLHFELKPSSSTISAMSAHGVKLAKGGVVAPSAGGTMALLAEAGQHERVTPLDAEGFTPAERRMLEALESSLGGGGGGDTYNVHPTPGMNETALADLVLRRVAWNRRRGTGRR
jgi:murein DD-endopeptidase MepM/ murein hydrolase activator NlpD